METARSRHRARVTARDRVILAFAAEHRLILAAHVQALLGISAGAVSGRLRALTRAGYLRYERKLAGPGCYQIDRRGLGAVQSRLPRPREIDLAGYKHDVGLAWLWLAAGRGALGRVGRLVSEREMRSHDGRLGITGAGGEEPLGVRLPGVGPHGGERRHYPDLLLETASGHRVALELELTTKTRGRREEILGAYAVDARIDAVLYLVETAAAMRAIERSAAAIGISDLVHAQRVAFGHGSGVEARARSADRAPTLAQARSGERALALAPETER